MELWGRGRLDSADIVRHITFSEFRSGFWCRSSGSSGLCLRSSPSVSVGSELEVGEGGFCGTAGGEGSRRGQQGESSYG